VKIQTVNYPNAGDLEFPATDPANAPSRRTITSRPHRQRQRQQSSEKYETYKIHFGRFIN
jgi:hypothetical protein